MKAVDRRRKGESLRESNARLHLLVEEAEQALAALVGGEVDAISVEASSTPMLLRAAQKDLRESQQLLRAVFDGARDSKVLVDADGVCADANPAACELF